MNSINLKLTISAVIIVVVAIALVVTGLTKPETDDSHGMLIDFGYWDVTWKEMTFEDDMNGYDALNTVCEMLGYEVYVRDVVHPSSGLNVMNIVIAIGIAILACAAVFIGMMWYRGKQAS